MTAIPFVDIHTHQVKTANALTILNVFAGEELPLEHPFNIYFSVGIHPWHLENWQNKLRVLEFTNLNGRVAAIGECGLDKNAVTSMKLQEEVFRLQIELSESAKKPLIIHCVKAFEELFRIKKEIKPVMPWIIHGFNKNPSMGEQCLKQGLILSFGKVLFTDHKILSLIRNLGTDQFFLETEQAQTEISKVFTRCADIKNCTLEDLQQNIFYHFCKVFGIFGYKEPQL